MSMKLETWKRKGKWSDIRCLLCL
ncbi:hypothetical protein OIU78_001166, partial [Salix suchowensis]